MDYKRKRYKNIFMTSFYKKLFTFSLSQCCLKRFRQLINCNIMGWDGIYLSSQNFLITQILSLYLYFFPLPYSSFLFLQASELFMLSSDQDNQNATFQFLTQPLVINYFNVVKCTFSSEKMDRCYINSKQNRSCSEQLVF